MNSEHASFHRYGARGIKFDPRWETFEGFLEDMGATWFKGAEIHRKDGNGDYNSANCVWLDASAHNLAHWASYTPEERAQRGAAMSAGIARHRTLEQRSALQRKVWASYTPEQRRARHKAMWDGRRRKAASG